MKIGARIIKTGIAVTITMFICKTLGLEPAFFGAVSAVINMQPSIFLTFKTSRDQICVHLLAVTTAIGLGSLIGGNPLSMGLITILIIIFYRKLKLQSGISTGVVAAVFILSSSPEQFLPHALMRTGVIFTGLFTAMLINIVLWPPHYSRKFKEKLNESNLESVRYFCSALHSYVQLENKEPQINEQQQKRVHQLNTELHVLANFFKREGELFSPASSEQGDWFTLAKKFIDYNESLIEKADRVYTLLPARYERRLQAAYPPISPEFKVILELLASRCATIDRINGKLRNLIVAGISLEMEEISEEYWEQLMRGIDEWHSKITTSYHLHALIEVAVIANEIKLAARQGKKLLYEGMQKKQGNN